MLIPGCTVTDSPCIVVAGLVPIGAKIRLILAPMGLVLAIHVFEIPGLLRRHARDKRRQALA
jgi:hypothetical protein